MWPRESGAFFESLNPGVEKRGVAVFDVPRGKYKLYLSSRILFWEKEAFIQLEVEEK